MEKENENDIINMYWYCVVAFRLLGVGWPTFEPRLYTGPFTEIVKSVAAEEESDKHHTEFALVSWQSITHLEYSEMQEVI